MTNVQEGEGNSSRPLLVTEVTEAELVARLRGVLPEYLVHPVESAGRELERILPHTGALCVLVSAEGSCKEILRQMGQIRAGGHSVGLILWVDDPALADTLNTAGPPRDLMLMHPAMTSEELRRAVVDAPGGKAAGIGQQLDPSRMIAHDIRAPLHLIGGFTTLLEHRLEAGGAINRDIRHLFHLIRKAGRSAEDILDNLMSLGAMEDGHARLRPAQVRLQTVVEAVADRVTPMLEDARVRIATEVCGDGDGYWLDQALVEQALYNLTINAIQVSPANALVGLSAEGKGAEACFAVRDEGPGIPKEKLEQIFNKYERLGKSEGKGRGLGLAMVRMLAGLHQGRVSVESTPGAGACFTLHLPSLHQA